MRKSNCINQQGPARDPKQGEGMWSRSRYADADSPASYMYLAVLTCIDSERYSEIVH